MEKHPLIVLTGPTAAGKTGLSVKLAKAIGGEIISADSMQVYRHMDIGSDKIRPQQMQGVAHHLIDILEPWEEFNVVIFQKKCRECIGQIYERGHVPILAGGTCFYIQAVLRGIDFTESEEDPAYRHSLEQLAKEKGASALHEMLCRVDKAAAQAIHQNNIKRTVRALEFYHLTGSRISEHNERERKKESAYDSCYFVLSESREKLYERIDARVDEMLDRGLVEEVRALKDAGMRREMVSMQGLGYKEILSFLEGECTLEEAASLIKRDTRHFAKRQLTWLKREKDAIWIDRESFSQDEDKMVSFMTEKILQAGILQG